MSFSDKILDWYQHNKRNLPWRGTINPYNIWLSEIILQQTRVAQGTPYYLKFIEAFPNVEDMAKASEAQILKLWQGLGYYSRARNLHATAKMVVADYGGKFPSTYKELLRLKGVGDYTASAIASICFNERQAVVDGNVYRVLARYFGIDIPINSTDGVKHFKSLAQELLHESNVRDYNQGIMEFGAIQCAPKKPYCLHCPLNNGCVALKEGKVDLLPIKLKKTKVRNRYFNYLVPILNHKKGNTQTILRQRQGKGIWQHLWEFPLLESESELNLEQIEKEYRQVLDFNEKVNITLFNTKSIVHKLSHQHLNTKFWILEGNLSSEEGISITEIKKFPVPVLIADFMKTFKF
ncbi:A/G-specific adenine glycosylase [Maribacter sp. 4U21]|uniref:A/G-specific adenine glycosylase n=1 Tax=Maribacter sp. 4U21 TaxID=1889779 RepID=UPI000C14970A|nr:A/G-specific adenine glycosylase [Maribacter sp. 4U21]PIB30898.1 A/G-specific adenine glycosylase [Maribacter sp. 4U21]